VIFYIHCTIKFSKTLLLKKSKNKKALKLKELVNLPVRVPNNV
jgi:hypothetical protein